MRTPLDRTCSQKRSGKQSSTGATIIHFAFPQLQRFGEFGVRKQKL